MALTDFGGLVPNAYGANTGNVMTFGNPAVQQSVGSPAAFAAPELSLSPPEAAQLLWELGLGDGNPDTTTGAAPDNTGAVGIGIGPASGMPGTGGIGGLGRGMMSMLSLTTNPIGFLGRMALNMALGNPGGGDPSAMGMNDDSNAQPGNQAVSPANNPTAMGPDADAAQNNAQGSSGSGTSGEDGGVASAGGDSAGPGPGVWKGGPITKDIVRGPKPNKHDDGTTGVKIGEYMLNVKAATKIGKDVLDKLNSGDFDPAMLRFAVLRKVGK